EPCLGTDIVHPLAEVKPHLPGAADERLTSQLPQVNTIALGQRVSLADDSNEAITLDRTRNQARSQVRAGDEPEIQALLLQCFQLLGRGSERQIEIQVGMLMAELIQD